MEKERLEELIIDYIDNRLNAIDRQMIEQELLTNATARKLYHELSEVIRAIEQSTPFEPSKAQRKNFEEMLSREIKTSRSDKVVWFTPSLYRAAAAVALLVVGVSLGFWISKYNAQQESLADLKDEMEVARKQIEDTKHMMLTMLGNENSASQRIKGLNVAIGLPDADEEIVTVLFNTLQNDPNTNVRLAALDALARFQQDPGVRKQLIGSLQSQRDPMVQIRLIQLMVDMKEKSIVDDLQEIIDDQSTMKAVKDEAYSGILKLS